MIRVSLELAELTGRKEAGLTVIHSRIQNESWKVVHELIVN